MSKTNFTTESHRVDKTVVVLKKTKKHWIFHSSFQSWHTTSQEVPVYYQIFDTHPTPNKSLRVSALNYLVVAS